MGGSFKKQPVNKHRIVKWRYYFVVKGTLHFRNIAAKKMVGPMDPL